MNNNIEDRLRSAYRSATDTVRPGSLRGLDEQGAVISYPLRHPAGRARRNWLAALTASAAVAAVIVALAVVVPASLRADRGAGGQVAVASGNPATHFLVALSGKTRKYLTVHSVATGADLRSVVAVTAHETFTAVATGNGRTYVAALSKDGSCGSWLYQFRLSKKGKFTDFRKLWTGHVNEVAGQLAISENGRKLAFAATRCVASAGTSSAVLGAVNLVSGTAKLWSLTGLARSASELTSLSLTSTGSVLAYSTDHGLYTLPTKSEPGTALQRSHKVISAGKFGSASTIGSATITPDGRVIYFGINAGGTTKGLWTLRSVSLLTAKLGVLATLPGYTTDVAVNPTATKALAFVSTGRIQDAITRPSDLPTPTPTPTPSATIYPSTVVRFDFPKGIVTIQPGTPWKTSLNRYVW